jgi:hypothetical protein
MIHKAMVVAEADQATVPMTADRVMDRMTVVLVIAVKGIEVPGMVTQETMVIPVTAVLIMEAGKTQVPAAADLGGAAITKEIMTRPIMVNARIAGRKTGTGRTGIISVGE